VLAIAATHAGARFMSPQKQAEWAWIRAAPICSCSRLRRRSWRR